MRYFLFSLLTTILVASLALGSLFKKSDNHSDLLMPYIEWIVENSEYEYNNEPLPDITFMTRQEMNYLFYGETILDESQRIEALYDTIQNRIILPEGTDITSYHTAPAIVHELVHFLQMTAGNFGKVCMGQLEITAYELQIAWMDQINHTDPRPDEFTFRSLILMCF